MKFLLITSGQPSLNPRLVKEADTLANAGHEVAVLYAYWNEWGTKYDQDLISSRKWNAVRIGGDPDERPVKYFLSRLIHKAANFTIMKIGPGNNIAEMAIARGSYFLMKEAVKYSADLYIAHNLGALAAAVTAAKANKKPCGFDAEDFHRNEVSNDKNSIDVKLKTYLEDKYIPQVNYFSTSSPLITKAYRQLYPDKDPVTVLNVFSKNTQLQKRGINLSGTIKLFWFSQTVGYNRGIEQVIEALKILNNKFYELHLLGYADDAIKKQFLKLMSNCPSKIIFHQTVQPDNLISFASGFDIGLAAENSIPFNRDICLTNKIFIYLQAGLAIVASNTSAQQSFLQSNPTTGCIYQRENIQSLVAVLNNYHLNIDQLSKTKEASLALGNEEMNWENESKKFMSIVNETLK